MTKMTQHPVSFIFCISTGRSGTDYLKTLFDHSENCHSFHEKDPICNGRAMYNYLRGRQNAMRKLTEQKTNKIQEITHDGSTYVETNHCFLKGFGWIIPQYIPEDKIGVVILTRDKTKTANSLLRTSSTPLTAVGKKWMVTPAAKGSFLKPPTRYLLPPKLTYLLFLCLKQLFRGKKLYTALGLKKPSTPQLIIDYEYECCKWYVEETAAQTKAYRNRFKNISFYKVDLEELNHQSKIEEMFGHFGLVAKPSLIDIIGKPTNLKDQVIKPNQSTKNYYGD